MSAMERILLAPIALVAVLTFAAFGTSMLSAVFRDEEPHVNLGGRVVMLLCGTAWLSAAIIVATGAGRVVLGR